MSQTVTLGGDRLGTGKKMKVTTKGFDRSTHDQSRIFRSSMSIGTLVPFLFEYGLPGTTFDIDLQCEVLTLPTVGPLFGSAKVQLDVFQIPVRLYNSWLHNNRLNIGRKMSDIKLPQIELNAKQITDFDEITDLNNCQINPSCLLKYIGISGIGVTTTADQTRLFNALGILAYWDTIKNYYANKQEEIGAVIHTPQEALVETIDDIERTSDAETIPQAPATASVLITTGETLNIAFTGADPLIHQIMFQTDQGQKTAEELFDSMSLLSPGIMITTAYDGRYGDIILVRWDYTANNIPISGTPKVATFDLNNIDQMRDDILTTPGNTQFTITTASPEPYKWLVEAPNDIPNSLSNQEGLALKTYLSDLFNNWLNTENIEAITTLTGIDVSGGVLTIDQFIVSKKIWDMLNAINVSGGTFDDYNQVVYDHDAYRKCETPMYMGGLIRELVFQEVVSNSQTPEQPLGTLAGKRRLAGKQKGGHIVIRCDEQCIIMGLASITPRLDYSQGNDWHVQLKTMEDFHNPYLDGIGFQDLITEQMAWWDTHYDTASSTWLQKSAGKQPAWVNYMTAINKTYGNFAIENKEMFMTWNRRYEPDTTGPQPTIKDLTTYIDPVKFNYLFAETSLDAQNFWCNIGIDMTSRRKMSAKIMPHL